LKVLNEGYELRVWACKRNIDKEDLSGRWRI
jgi:hypothetical protein